MIEALAGSSGGYGRTRHTCPVCPEKVGVIDYKGSLSVDHVTGWVRCFRCNYRMRLSGFQDAFIEEQEDDPTDVWEPLYKFNEPSDYNPVADDDSLALARARKYLKSRGVSRRAARDAQIGYAIEGWSKDMVVTPFLDHDGCWMGWQGRTLAYKSFHTQRDRASLFWNEPAVLDPLEEPLLVVEGVYDALPYWPNAVACLGKPYGAQVDLLAQATRPLALVLDADSHLYAESLANELERCGSRVLSVRLAPGDDPSTTDREALASIVRSAFK